ncbi:hypothetical protein C8F01DRAFT_1105379 [Mycena amicta]|nr:hypothetical protein C8F01DRAFT_1105379 [Mycena amicta]
MLNSSKARKSAGACMMTTGANEQALFRINNSSQSSFFPPTTTMKPGFLNSSKAEEASPCDAPDGDTVTVAFAAEDKSFLKMPYGKREKVEVPKDFGASMQFQEVHYETDYEGTHQADYIFTTMPPTTEPTTECLILPKTKSLLLKTPGFPQPLPSTPSPPAFRLISSPGKGLGLFSTRALKQGELILCERPLLITPLGVRVFVPPSCTPAQFVQHSLNEFERFAEVAVNRMEEDRREAFMKLHNSHTEDGSGPIVGRIRTNGVGVDGLQPGELGKNGNTGKYNAICEHISRLNHSCSPNTSSKFDRASLSFKLYAVRDIAAGDELTFPYIDTQCSKVHRNKALEPYDFQCTCPACTEPTTESDPRREAIDNFIPTIAAWVRNRQLPDDWLINKSMELLELIEKEQLQHLEMYYEAAKAIMESYICLGDVQRASEWAAHVKQRPWSDLYDDSVDSLLDPKSPAFEKHGLWRARVDEVPKGQMGQLLKMMADLAGPGGMKTLDGGQGFFMFAPASGQPLPDAFRKQFNL